MNLVSHIVEAALFVLGGLILGVAASVYAADEPIDPTILERREQFCAELHGAWTGSTCLYGTAARRFDCEQHGGFLAIRYDERGKVSSASCEQRCVCMCEEDKP